MIHRRRFLCGTAAVAAAAVAGEAQSQPGSDIDAAFLRLIESLTGELLRRSPEQVTSLGLDRGPMADSRSQLDDRSLAAVWNNRRQLADHLRRLRTIDRSGLSPRAMVQFDSYLYSLETAELFSRWPGSGSPYVLDQHGGGAYLSVPTFLDNQHPIETKSDADAYMERLAAFPAALDHECRRLRHDAARGIVPPDFIINLSIEQLAHLADTPAAASTLVTSLAERSAAKGIAGDYAQAATAIYEREVVPALRRQAIALGELLPQATPDPGVWKLPDGEDYYASALRASTTSAMGAGEIHALGLDLVREISARLDQLMRAQGLTQGSVGARLRAMFDDPRFRYPNNDLGREQLLTEVDEWARAARNLMPRLFGTLPRAELITKRIPPHLEAGATSGYETPSLDGSRPGIFWINLRDTAETPRFLMPTIVYHEALPGHHLQLSLALEASLPLGIKLLAFNAYEEGWALYAEQLADEGGLYDNDPWGRIGYLHDALLRAGRLVVDTGLHAMRWSREQAVRYLVELLGDPESAMRTEIDRYCVNPGQACSYMVGKVTWLRLRAQAQDTLRAGFDIRGFHDAGLLGGSVPLAVLERVIGDYVARRKS